MSEAYTCGRCMGPAIPWGKSDTPDACWRCGVWLCDACWEAHGQCEHPELQCQPKDGTP